MWSRILFYNHYIGVQGIKEIKNHLPQLLHWRCETSIFYFFIYLLHICIISHSSTPPSSVPRSAVERRLPGQTSLSRWRFCRNQPSINWHECSAALCISLHKSAFPLSNTPSTHWSLYGSQRFHGGARPHCCHRSVCSMLERQHQQPSSFLSSEWNWFVIAEFIQQARVGVGVEKGESF